MNDATAPGAITDLSNADLLEQYADMVRWWHYDPMCSERPSEFDVDDLQAEVRRRLDLAAPVDANDEDDQ